MAQRGGCPILVLTQNSFRDPLFLGPVVGCLRAINSPPLYTFHVISYEQPRYEISGEADAAFEADLRQYGIFRHRLTWGPGRVSRKVLEFARGLLLAAWLRLRHRTVAIFALANVAGAFAYVMGRLLGMKVIVFTFEPHSEFMVECGVWQKDQLRYRLLHAMEGLVGRHADYVLTGTSHMVERLRMEGTRARVLRVPSCVDERVFAFRPEARTEIRRRLQVEGRAVFVYVGKLGDLYYKDEMGVLAAALREIVPNAFFLVLTPNEPGEVRRMFAAHGLEGEETLHVSCSELEDVPGWLSAADLGIVAVPPLPAQRFRSPIKVGEYLDCGLPYVVCRGVSEDDIWAERYGVGVVVEAFTREATWRQADRIRALLAEERTGLRARCRAAGIDYRGREIAAAAFSRVFREVCGEV